MSPRSAGPRPLALTILGLIVLPILAGIGAGAAGAFGAGYAVSYAGLNGGDGGPTAHPTLYMPSYTPPTPTGSPMVTAPPKTITKAPKVKTKAKADIAANATAIQLTATPTSVSHKDRITLSGTYPGGTGKVLQVQVMQGNKWKDFPVTVTVQAGSFTTFVITNQVGDVQFRVVETGSGTASNPVTVHIS
jgi:hypothetical protein